MTVYWLMFMAAAIPALAPKRLVESQQRIVWFLVGAVLALLIGFRHEVGGDWLTYESHFWRASQSVPDALSFGEPGYYLVGWAIAQLGGSVYLLNLVCGAILMVGVVVFCLRQPLPWLALVAAVPYLLIVVGMGYSRQAAAIGFVLLGLVSLGRQNLKTFVFLVLLGALFHKSALLMLPIAALANTRQRVWTGLWVAVVMGLGGWLLLTQDAERLVSSYIESDYAQASEGGPIRAVMNLIPALIFLAFTRRIADDDSERRLWTWMSLFAVACVPLLLVSTTGVDRVALYFIPLQLYVLSRLPLLAATRRFRTLLLVGVIGYYAAVQFVWLNFAGHAFAWVPYRFMPMFGSAW